MRSTGAGAPAQPSEIEAIVVAALRTQLRDVHGSASLDRLAGQVVTGSTDPYAAADVLIGSLEDVPAAT